MSEEQTTDQTAPTEAPASAQLQLADLVVCVQLVQLASTRGAFKAEEFTQIGAVYDRLVTFLRDSGAIQSAAPAEPEAPSESDQTAE